MQSIMRVASVLTWAALLCFAHFAYCSPITDRGMYIPMQKGDHTLTLHVDIGDVPYIPEGSVEVFIHFSTGKAGEVADCLRLCR